QDAVFAAVQTLRRAVGPHVETPLLIAALAGEPDAATIGRADGASAPLVAIGLDQRFGFAHVAVETDAIGVDVELVAARAVVNHPGAVRAVKRDTRFPV